MTEVKLYRLYTSDAERIDEIIQRIEPEIKKHAMKPVRQSTLLRALIFLGEKIGTEDLIEAVKQAQIYV